MPGPRLSLGNFLTLGLLLASFAVAWGAKEATITWIRADVSQLREVMSSLTTEVSSLQREIAKLRVELARIEERHRIEDTRK